MKKIGDVTSTADKNGEFTDGNVAAGTPPTQLMGDWFNSVQREIINVLIKAGVAQSKTKDDQLAEAIGKLIGSAGYQPDGYSYSKVESNLKFQPIGNYAPAGNYASADYFAQIGTYSMMESPNHKYRLVIHDDGRVSVHDNTNGGAAILGFSQAGEMTAGSVPASRVTGLVVNELGQSTTQVISQRTATNSFALSEFFGSGFADSWMKTPNKNNFIQILDDGNTNIVSNGNYNFTISPNGEITNGNISASRVTGLFSQYTNVKSQRSHGTTYKNPDNKPLFVIIGLDNGNGSIDVYVNNEQIYTSANTSDGISRMSVFFIVPPRGEYRTVSGVGFNTWSECA